MSKSGWMLGALGGFAAAVTFAALSTSSANADTTNPYFACSSVTLAATTATALPSSCTAGRTAVVVQNNDAASIYLGASTVTNSGATKGLTVVASATANVEVSCDAARTAKVYAYSLAGTSANAVTVCETR